MNAEKIRNLTEAELAHQQRDLADQLFKLKFQLKMGQTESLKKIAAPAAVAEKPAKAKKAAKKKTAATETK